MWFFELLVIVFAFVVGSGLVCLAGAMVWSGRLTIKGSAQHRENELRLQVMAAEASRRVAELNDEAHRIEERHYQRAIGPGPKWPD